MSDWIVVYRSITRGIADTNAPASPTREAALVHARAVRRQGHEVLRIEGPEGQVIGKGEIERWRAANPE